MNLYLPSIFLLSIAPAFSEKPFDPPRIGYQSLFDDASFQKARTSFVDALTDVGLISITDIPFTAKEEALSYIHDCAVASDVTQEQMFHDGTRRRTMATHTIPGGIQKMKHNSDKCNDFSKASDDFRRTVAGVTEAFAARLTTILDIDEAEKPLLSTAQGEVSFKDVKDVVANGEHLEHFHSYQRTEQKKDQTIDIHTDQGLFIVFTPGVFIDTQDSQAHPVVADGFYIELKDGSRVMVHFSENDDLVFMLGDGVNQVINAKLSPDHAVLRAAPHALTMPLHKSDEARVWYGRMVLPPMDAVHPVHTKQTYGDIRQALIDAGARGEDSHEAAGLACSSTKMVRNLAEETCEEGTLFCWHRCMDIAEFAVSEEICAAEGLDLRCINPRRQLYVEGHGDYYPACIDASKAENATAYPPLPEGPRDNEACSADLLDTFKNMDNYDKKVELGNATLLYTITDGMVDGRFVFNGVFGWLSLGFAKDGGSKNGMGGATVMMALPGGNYDPEFGLDLDMDPTVQEYVIDPEKSAFRHWMTPVSSATSISRATPGVSSYAVEATDCFTAITFKTDKIYKQSFNVNGMDDLIWGANAEDYYVGYHGRQNRARFQLDWTTGQASINGVPINQPSSNGGDDNTGSAAPSMSVVLGAAVAAIVGLFM